ncbi:hypothetical protein SDC9_168956 [bioreactor metagenome]|uniref:Uncharacterized protein n=1 Tax=bioreactor metagenome TaxID=1076179 RepID=A0A645G622_9ZZZZ
MNQRVEGLSAGLLPGQEFGVTDGGIHGSIVIEHIFEYSRTVKTSLRCFFAGLPPGSLVQAEVAASEVVSDEAGQ